MRNRDCSVCLRDSSRSLCIRFKFEQKVLNILSDVDFSLAHVQSCAEKDELCLELRNLVTSKKPHTLVLKILHYTSKLHKFF